jgi:hypothetical protein
MDETTNLVETPIDAPPEEAPRALDPLSPVPGADPAPPENPLGLDPLGPIRRFGAWS